MMPELQVPGRFSSIIGMGEVLKVHLVRRASKWGNLIATIIFFGSSIVILVGGSIATWLRIQEFGPAVQNQTIRSIFLPISILAIVLAVIGTFLAWSSFSNWQKAAVVYKNGIAYTDRKGLYQLPWTDITGMTAAVTKHYRNGIYTGTTHIYTIWDKDNKKHILNDVYQNVEELAGEIRKGIFPHLYQAAANNYNAGKTLVFGDIHLQKAHGIMIKKKTYPWNEVKEVTIHRGQLKIASKDGGWFSGANVAVAATPNLDVLLSILDQILKPKQQKGFSKDTSL